MGRVKDVMIECEEGMRAAKVDTTRPITYLGRGPGYPFRTGMYAGETTDGRKCGFVGKEIRNVVMVIEREDGPLASTVTVTNRGWQTVTTTETINMACRHYGLNMGAHQDHWALCFAGFKTEWTSPDFLGKAAWQIINSGLGIITWPTDGGAR